MNEFMQQNFKAVGMDIDFDVVEWGTMLVAIRNAPDAPQSHGDHGINISLSFIDPVVDVPLLRDPTASRRSTTTGVIGQRRSTDLLRRRRRHSIQAEQTKLLAKAHAIVVDEAPWLFIVHDLNPRALSKKVHGLPPGAKLVPGLHADHHGVRARSALTRRLCCLSS